MERNKRQCKDEKFREYAARERIPIPEKLDEKGAKS